MLKKLRLALEVLLCALVAVLAWKNGQMQTRMNELEDSLSATGELLWEAQAKASVVNVQPEIPEQEKRELMRLRGEVTALRNHAAQIETAPLLAARRAAEVGSPYAEALMALAENEPPSTQPILLMPAWTKVKIDQWGSITLGENALGSEEFAAELERVKNANGTFLLSIDKTNGQLNPAQIEAMHQIHKAGIPIRGAISE